jgi:hypothetical protein
MKPIVYRASIEDAINLAPQLRAVDVEEIRAASGSTPLAALSHGVKHSEPCYAIADDDGVFALMGVVPTMDPNYGSGWLLGSDRVVTHSREFLRQTSLWLDRFHDRYRVVGNFVSVDNHVHRRWLEWAGCTFNPYTFAFSGVEFLQFTHVRSSFHRRDGRRCRGRRGLRVSPAPER